MTFLQKTNITVVGCGGNRDKTKRPIMADIASNLSDKALHLIIQEMKTRSYMPKWKGVGAQKKNIEHNRENKP
jgi:UDP-N-acetylmuramyl tripeptide synthase